MNNPGKPRRWWIKEHYGTHLGTNYTGLGQITEAAATRHKRSAVGGCRMEDYRTEADYRERLDELKKTGRRVVENKPRSH